MTRGSTIDDGHLKEENHQTVGIVGTETLKDATEVDPEIVPGATETTQIGIETKEDTQKIEIGIETDGVVMMKTMAITTGVERTLRMIRMRSHKRRKSQISAYQANSPKK